MSRFNKTKNQVPAPYTNYAGGKAYKQSSEEELVSILLTSFMQDQFYRSANDTAKRVALLAGKVDALFAAKAAVFARTVFGMRSVSHVLAAELAWQASGTLWAKNFYNQVVHRPDDMTEILTYYFNTKVMVMPNAMKKGFAAAFNKFDGYQLAKYRGAGKVMKLVDVVNLVHPTPNERNREALALLVQDKLRSNNTWETKLTQAGQVANSDEEKNQLKAAAWEELITSGKLGYFALLRNLRNIIASVSDQTLKTALNMLTNSKLITQSLVLPFRFVTAYNELMPLKKEYGKKMNKVLGALEKAIDISLYNVPIFEGNTLVVLDTSGSMVGKPAEIGSLFAAILVKSNNADFITFSDEAAYQDLPDNRNTLTTARNIQFAMGGTNFNAIFETANKAYDRIIILSDMQGWVGYDTPDASFAKYKAKYKANPFVYSFDLQGYGSMQFMNDRVIALAGFSEKIFDFMAAAETNPSALIDRINQVTL